MKKEIFIIALSLTAIFGWCMNIWGGWAEKFYKKYKDKNQPWYWLKVFKVELTETNCVNFLKRISWLGLILIILLNLR